MCQVIPFPRPKRHTESSILHELRQVLRQAEPDPPMQQLLHRLNDIETKLNRLLG